MYLLRNCVANHRRTRGFFQFALLFRNRRLPRSVHPTAPMSPLVLGSSMAMPEGGVDLPHGGLSTLAQRKARRWPGVRSLDKRGKTRVETAQRSPTNALSK